MEMLHNIVLDRTEGLSTAQGGYRFRCPVFGTCNHRIVGMFLVRRRGYSETWVVAAIPNEHSCHACTSRLTLEVYRKRGGKWRKHKVWRNFAKAGNWGVVQPEGVRMGKIDERRMIIFVHSPFFQMGEAAEGVDVFIIDDVDVTPASAFCVHYDNEAAITPDTGMRLAKWRVRYELVSVNGKPRLVFHITDEAGGHNNTVIYGIIGKGLRPESLTDIRLRIPCGEYLYR